MVKVALVAVIESIVGAAAGWATRTDVRVGAEKERLLNAFVAKSAMAPLLRSKDVATAMPSESNSEVLLPTVYWKRAVLESDMERKLAYFVVEPTVRVSRGTSGKSLPGRKEPLVMVTDSLKTTVKVGVLVGK